MKKNSSNQKINTKYKETPYDLKSFGRLKVIGYKNVRYIPVRKKEVLYMRERLALFVYII